MSPLTSPFSARHSWEPDYLRNAGGRAYLRGSLKQRERKLRVLTGRSVRMPDPRTVRPAHRRVMTLVASVAFLLATAGGLAAAPAAYGAPLPVLSCQGAETLTFHPPL